MSLSREEIIDAAVNHFGEPKRGEPPRWSNGNGGEHPKNGTFEEEAPPAIAFLKTVVGDAAWRLTAIREIRGRKDIKADLFDGENREARAIEWIERHNQAGANIYFSPNPLKRRDLVKASKADVVSANWLWAESDPPRKRTDGKPESIDGDDLLAWRKAHIANMATMPEGVPPPTLFIDSGRGFWLFWKLAEPFELGGDPSKCARRELRAWRRESLWVRRLLPQR